MATQAKKKQAGRKKANPKTIATRDEARRGISIHIGLAVLSRYTYGEPPIIGSCETDAREMSALAAKAGFTTPNGAYPANEVLLNADATREKVFLRLAAAKKELRDGDSLLITFSGHGATFEKDSEFLQACCLYDQPLFDTEIAPYLDGFKEVEILFVADSCDAGGLSTPGTARATVRDSTPGPTITTERADELRLGAVKRILGGVTMEDGVPETPTINADTPNPLLEIPDPSNPAIVIFGFDEIKGLAAAAAGTKAHAVFIAACGINQDTHAGATPKDPSIFTQNLLSVWDDGNFEGSFEQFVRLLRINTTTAIPEYKALQPESPSFLARGPFRLKPLP